MSSRFPCAERIIDNCTKRGTKLVGGKELTSMYFRQHARCGIKRTPQKFRTPSENICQLKASFVAEVMVTPRDLLANYIP
jgi:hypothetical protein